MWIACYTLYDKWYCTQPFRLREDVYAYVNRYLTHSEERKLRFVFVKEML